MKTGAEQQPPPNLTGCILAATPGLMDPNFYRTILLLPHHSAKEGALGLVLNRPLPVRLAELAPDAGALADVPLYYGGPVAMDQPVLLGLRWDDNTGLEFHNFAAISEYDEIPDHWRPHLRIFIGHSGWSPGQLENEIQQNSWFVLNPVRELIEPGLDEKSWGSLLAKMSPALRLFSGAPLHPEWN